MVGVCSVAWTKDSADARFNLRKGIWGTLRFPGGKSAFPTYRQLGAGIFSVAVDWSAVATRRPSDPGNPGDPAYRWPPDLALKVAGAHANGMNVTIEITKAPGWANGGHSSNWAPRDPRDFANFASATARKYPGVRNWIVWGEPSRRANFMPYDPAPWSAKILSAKQSQGPRRYARIVDATYVALKRINGNNHVIGGSTFSAGDIRPEAWIRNMRLPNGKPPRMDFYSHNPFTRREPDLTDPPFGNGYMDFSDLKRLSAVVNRFLARPRGKRQIKLYLAEWCISTNRGDWEFFFHVTPETQARWIRSAFRIVNSRNSFIQALVWIHLFDADRKGSAKATRSGLIFKNGARKPGFAAFAAG